MQVPRRLAGRPRSVAPRDGQGLRRRPGGQAVGTARATLYRQGPRPGRAHSISFSPDRLRDGERTASHSGCCHLRRKCSPIPRIIRKPRR